MNSLEIVEILGVRITRSLHVLVEISERTRNKWFYFAAFWTCLSSFTPPTFLVDDACFAPGRWLTDRLGTTVEIPVHTAHLVRSDWISSFAGHFWQTPSTLWVFSARLAWHFTIAVFFYFIHVRFVILFINYYSYLPLLFVFSISLRLLLILNLILFLLNFCSFILSIWGCRLNCLFGFSFILFRVFFHLLWLIIPYFCPSNPLFSFQILSLFLVLPSFCSPLLFYPHYLLFVNSLNVTNWLINHYVFQ